MAHSSHTGLKEMSVARWDLGFTRGSCAFPSDLLLVPWEGGGGGLLFCEGAPHAITAVISVAPFTGTVRCLSASVASIEGGSAVKLSTCEESCLTAAEAVRYL